MIRNARLIGSVTSTLGSPREISSARRRFSSISGPEHETEDERRRLAVELEAEVAEHGKERHHEQVEGRCC